MLFAAVSTQRRLCCLSPAGASTDKAIAARKRRVLHISRSTLAPSGASGRRLAPLHHGDHSHDLDSWPSLTSWSRTTRERIACPMPFAYDAARAAADHRLDLSSTGGETARFIAEYLECHGVARIKRGTGALAKRSTRNHVFSIWAPSFRCSLHGGRIPVGGNDAFPPLERSRHRRHCRNARRPRRCGHAARHIARISPRWAGSRGAQPWWRTAKSASRTGRRRP
jgi:hypothetical protein